MPYLGKEGQGAAFYEVAQQSRSVKVFEELIGCYKICVDYIVAHQISHLIEDPLVSSEETVIGIDQPCIRETLKVDSMAVRQPQQEGGPGRRGSRQYRIVRQREHVHDGP